MLTIEPNIPIPAPGTRKHRVSKYPLREMQIGDSFLLSRADFTEEELRRALRAITSNASRWKTRVSYRQVEGGVRVWRVA